MELEKLLAIIGDLTVQIYKLRSENEALRKANEVQASRSE